MTTILGSVISLISRAVLVWVRGGWWQVASGRGQGAAQIGHGTVHSAWSTPLVFILTGSAVCAFTANPNREPNSNHYTPTANPTARPSHCLPHRPQSGLAAPPPGSEPAGMAVLPAVVFRVRLASWCQVQVSRLAPLGVGGQHAHGPSAPQLILPPPQKIIIIGSGVSFTPL